MEISPVRRDVGLTRAETSSERSGVAVAVVLGLCAVASAAAALTFARRLTRPHSLLARLGSSLSRMGASGTASSLGALALGACATGAFATGGLALGAVAVGRLKIRRLEIETIRVGRWEGARDRSSDVPRGVEPWWP